MNVLLSTCMWLWKWTSLGGISAQDCNSRETWGAKASISWSYWDNYVSIWSLHSTSRLPRYTSITSAEVSGLWFSVHRRMYIDYEVIATYNVKLFFIISRWFSDSVRLGIIVFTQIWDNSPSRSSLFRKINYTACMFNFLCGCNVTPNFSDDDLGGKIYLTCRYIQYMFPSYILFGASDCKFMVWYMLMAFCQNVELLINDTSFPCIIAHTVHVFFLRIWFLTFPVLQR